MKKNKMINLKKICYLLLIISVLSGIFTVVCFGRELRGNNVSNIKKVVNSNACIGKAYFEEIFSERISNMELLAKRISEQDLSNRGELAAVFEELNGYFDDISILDINGIRLYGNCLYKSVSNSEGFEKALDKKANVADEITINYEGNDEINIFAPIIYKNKVRAVIVGSMLLRDLKNKLIASGITKYGSVIIVSDSGDVLADTNVSSKLEISADTNIFTYLNECKVYGGIDNSGVRTSIRNARETDFLFRHNKYNYIVTTAPTRINNWSFMFVSKGSRNNLSEFFITSKSMNFIKILLVNLICIMTLLIFAVKSREKLLDIEKIYDAVSKIDKTIIFQYYFNPKKFELKDKFGIIIDKGTKPLMGEAIYDVYDYIHPDDLSIRSRLRKFFESKEDFFTSEVRVLNRNGEYDWYRVSGFVKRGDNGSPKCFIGKLMDASKQITMEKNLVQRAENDMLTGVLNKKTIEEKMGLLLNENKSDRYYIFYMVDLDNFKNVNDTLGHIYGDKAIADTGAELSKIFKNDALVGRLGGDEFAVCSVYDAFDDESLKEYIIKKAEQVKKANQRSYTDGVNVVNITSSIGVSVAPKDGNDFETIYKKADSALYHSKNTGKDRYTLYNGELWKK